MNPLKRVATILLLPAPQRENATLMKRIPHGAWRVAGVICLIAVIFRLAIMWKTGWGMSDDAMIMLRIARNLATGNGFTFNPGSYVQSSTSPIWAFMATATYLLAGEKAITIIPILSLLLDSLAAGVLVLLTSLIYQSFEAAIPGLIYASISTCVLIAPLGLDTGLYVLLITLTFLLFELERNTWAAVLAACAALTRPDGALVVAVFLVALLIRYRRLPLKEAAIIALIAAPYVVFAFIYHGALIPQTVTAKSVVFHSSIEQWNTFLSKFFIGSTISLLTGGLFLIGCWVLIFRRGALTLLILWGALYVFCYSTFAAWWPWYFPPVMLVFSIGMGVGIIEIIKRGRKPLRIAVVILVVGVLSFKTAHVARDAFPASVSYQHHMEVARAINEHSATDASVMIEPLGIVGYYSPRHFDDYPGLASNAVSDSLRELGGSVSGKPNDPAVMRNLLGKVKPTVLVLREDEYRPLINSDVLSDYSLIETVLADPKLTARAAWFQTMYIMGRRNDPRIH